MTFYTGDMLFCLAAKKSKCHRQNIETSVLAKGNETNNWKNRLDVNNCHISTYVPYTCDDSQNAEAEQPRNYGGNNNLVSP